VHAPATRLTAVAAAVAAAPERCFLDLGLEHANAKNVVCSAHCAYLQMTLLRRPVATEARRRLPWRLRRPAQQRVAMWLALSCQRLLRTRRASTRVPPRTTRIAAAMARVDTVESSLRCHDDLALVAHARVRTNATTSRLEKKKKKKKKKKKRILKSKRLLKSFSCSYRFPRRLNLQHSV
jgi:hypothetical protein